MGDGVAQQVGTSAEGAGVLGGGWTAQLVEYFYKSR